MTVPNRKYGSSARSQSRISPNESPMMTAASQKTKEEVQEAMEKTPLKNGKYNEDAKSSNKLTRAQLMELEERDKSPRERLMDAIITILPIPAVLIALAEYLLIPDCNPNPMPHMYTAVLVLVLVFYVVKYVIAKIKEKKGDRTKIRKLRYKAPLVIAILLLLALYDYLTIKINYFTYPLVPCVNSIMYAAYTDRATLIECAGHTLLLMFKGYFIGVALGLVTGITCGYSRRVNYWIDPILKFMGPIPISTWIPIIAVLSATLSGGALFIIVVGVWTAVTNAARAGVANVDKAYFDAAKILGASETQLIFRVAIPAAMPNIMAGMTQGMMTACTAIMVAEMMGVKGGLGWYITWVKSWALYNNMFASLFIICLIFTIVTKALNAVKARVLRWQIGVTK